MRRLKKEAVPSLFKWTKHIEPKQQHLTSEKLRNSRAEQEEETDKSSEAETEMCNEGLSTISRKVQTFSQENYPLHNDLACKHRFSVSHLRSKCMYSMKKEVNFFNHFTGFSSYTNFSNVLNSVLPDLDRKRLVYWGTSQAKASYINTEKLFTDSESEDPDADNDCILQSLPSNHSFPMTRVVSHLLPIESKFLLTQMKIRMGLSNLDLAERFDISEGKVTNTFLTWINYLYLTLGSLKFWPDRKVIIDNSPEEFKKKFPEKHCHH